MFVVGVGGFGDEVDVALQFVAAADTIDLADVRSQKRPLGVTGFEEEYLESE